jgi:VanZ family protein
MSSRTIVKASGVAVLLLLLVFAAIGPAKLQVRTGLGWQFDHVIGYFGFTLMFCLAWPRPFRVGGILIACAFLLEALQALTPDRYCDFHGALYSAAGALAAAMFAYCFTPTLTRLSGRMLAIPRYFRLRWLSRHISRTRLVTASGPGSPGRAPVA